MDDANGGAKPDPKELEPRPPVQADLAALRPFASPRLLWRMKVVTHREKDAADLLFLRYWFAERGEQPPGI